MGFLSDLFTTAAPILATAFGGPAGGAAASVIVAQINRPPTGGVAARPSFAAAPSEEPSFFAQLGTALLPVAGRILQQELAPDVPTTVIAPLPAGRITEDVLGTTGTFTTAQRSAEIAARRQAAGLSPLTSGLFGSAAGVSLGIGAVAGAIARTILRGAANPLVGGAVGSAVGTVVGLRGLESFRRGAAVTVAPIGQRILRGELTPAQAVAGQAGTFRRTIVQTVSRATGQVVRQEEFRGSPFLMNHDIVVAKKVFRMAQKLHGRLPRRQVKRKAIDCPPINQFIQERVLSHALQAPK